MLDACFRMPARFHSACPHHSLSQNTRCRENGHNMKNMRLKRESKLICQTISPTQTQKNYAPPNKRRHDSRMCSWEAQTLLSHPALPTRPAPRPRHPASRRPPAPPGRTGSHCSCTRAAADLRTACGGGKHTLFDAKNCVCRGGCIVHGDGGAGRSDDGDEAELGAMPVGRSTIVT